MNTEISYIAKEKSDYKPIPEGIHSSVCSAFIDLGMQEAFGVSKPQFLLRFEFPDARVNRVENGSQISEPMAKYQFYTKSLNIKSNLRRDLEGILGRGLTKEELKDGYAIPSLINQACLITIIHDHSGEQLKDKIRSIGKFIGDEAPPQPELEVIRYSKDAGAIEQWDLLPEWIKEIVRCQTGDVVTPSMTADESPSKIESVSC